MYKEFLNIFAEKSKSVLGKNLIGIYLHGSLVFGCFNPKKSDIDLILVPGLIRKDTFLIAEEFNIPCYKASTDAADLAMVLDLVDDLELSQSTPADKLIIEEKKKSSGFSVG